MTHKKAASTFLILLLVSSSAWSEDRDDKKVAGSSSGFVGDTLSLPFKAAEGVMGSVFDLGSVIVSGKRLSSPFSEFVSNNVSSTEVITREDINLYGARNLPEALSQSTGVVLTDLVGNGEEATLDYRGYNEGSDFIFFLDGVRLNEPKSNNMNFPLVPIGLIDRIEISRGGASFLYGEGAMGGVANIVGLFPKENGIHGKVKSLVGSFEEWGESFEVSVRDNNLGIYATGDVYSKRGFRQNTSVDKQDFYTKLAWDVFEKGRVGFSYLYANAHLDRSGSIRETYLERFGREATERPRNFTDLESNLGIINFDFEPMESIAVSSNVFLRQTSELSVANFATFDTNDNELDLDVDTWGFAVQADHSKPLFWGLTEGLLFGVDYVNNGIDEQDYNRSKATLERLAQVVDSDSEKEAVGVFSKASLSWNEKLGGYFGIRYDDIQFTNTDRINLDNNEPSEVSEVSYSAGASYQIIEPLAVSATYSHSFRAPTLADLYANPLFGGNPQLKPEESESYELGVQWKKSAILLKSSIFLDQRENEIGFDPNLTDATHLFGRNNNFGETERRGVESMIEVKPLPWLRWRGTHTYTEAFFKTNTTTAEISGDHIPLVPRNRFATDILVQPTKNWDIQLNMLAVSKQVLGNDLTNDRNGERLPAYTVFNLKTIYRVRGWEFAFEIKNLLDEEYESGGTLGAAPSPFNADPTVEDNFFIPAPGRSFGGAASYSW